MYYFFTVKAETRGSNPLRVATNNNDIGGDSMVDYKQDQGRDKRRMTITSSTLVTVDEAAQELGLPPDTIHWWLRRGHIERMGYRPQPMGRPKTLIDIEALHQFLANRQ